MQKSFKIILGILVIVIVSFGVWAAIWKSDKSTVQPSEEHNEEPVQNENEQVKEQEPNPDFPRMENLVTNLQIPWALDFLPSGEIVFTERSGNVKTYNFNTKQVELIGTISDVHSAGEGGLLGIAVHPDSVEDNSLIYLYYTYREGNLTKNKVVRYSLLGNNFTHDKVIIADILGAGAHNGGRIKFDSDGFLYIGTGDANQPGLSQNPSALEGKILRVTDEGEIPSDNPFGTVIYSLGHRNVQGLAFDATGQLWATEHGPSARDEVNRIVSGVNYGWPQITGNQTRQNMQTPFINSGSDTWAPSGLAAIGEHLYFVGLRGNALFRLNIQTRQLEKYFEGELGRLREIVAGEDGMLYIGTSNHERGSTVRQGDDKIIRVNPDKL